MSWMGGAGSFESRAKRAFGKQKSSGVDARATETDALAALSAPLHGFKSRASAMFGMLDNSPAWVVGGDAEAAGAAAEAAAVAAASAVAASATGISMANMLANSMHDLVDDDDQEECDPNDGGSRPPSHTAVLDGNAYDRKMGLCMNQAAKPNAMAKKGKRLGWSPDQVQVIDDTNDCVVLEDGPEESVPSSIDANGARLSRTTSASVAPAEPELQKIVRKGILKSTSNGRGDEAACDRSQAASAPPQASPSAAFHKPCFEFAQTGQCRRGAGCRFQHTVAPCIANPERYTRYEISWDEEEDKGTNKAAAMATLALLRAKDGLSEEERIRDEEASNKEAAAREERQRMKRERLKAESEGSVADSSGNGRRDGGEGPGESGGGRGNKKKKAKTHGSLLSFGDDD